MVPLALQKINSQNPGFILLIIYKSKELFNLWYNIYQLKKSFNILVMLRNQHVIKQTSEVQDSKREIVSALRN